MFQSRRLLRLLSICSALALFAAACGGGSSDGDAGAADAAESGTVDNDGSDTQAAAGADESADGANRDDLPKAAFKQRRQP